MDENWPPSRCQHGLELAHGPPQPLLAEPFRPDAMHNRATFSGIQ
jgi:hypothetical protein